MPATLTDHQHALLTSRTTSSDLTEAALARALDPAGEGPRAFTKVYAEQARAAARASDTLRAAGLSRSPIDGVPISIKDLFDVAGEATLGGSVARRDEPVATAHAVVVQRLMAAGAVIVGRTNMTEFAYSGLGINPHYGTPRNPWDRETGRIPGGSSAGAAVSVADGMAAGAIGSDTGGSVRIPAALCGLTGFKPTASRVSMEGVQPLSSSLDSIGPISHTVQDCATLDAILAGEAPTVLKPAVLRGLRLAIPTTLVFDKAEAHVTGTVAAAVARLTDGGARVEEIAVPEFDTLAGLNAKGGLIAAEAWAWHHDQIARTGDRYDPRVVSRIRRGKDMTAADYIELLQARRAWIASVEARIAGFDALLLPTVPLIAPRIDELSASDEVYFATNGLMLRNPTLINFLDGCALSVPCHEAGTAPVGLMIAGAGGQDKRILSIGLAVEQALAAITGR